MLSWIGARTVFENRTNRVAVSLAGLAPDVDGIGLLIDAALKVFSYHSNYWGLWHHKLHSLPFGVFVCFLVSFFVRTQRKLTFIIAFLLFNLHVFCDLIGSQGPDGYQWPIPYFSPFLLEIELTWSGQWELNGWQNILITFLSFIYVWLLIKSKNTTPFEVFSKSLDVALTKIVVDRKA